jgi:hypothetical protein
MRPERAAHARRARKTTFFRHTAIGEVFLSLSPVVLAAAG